MEEAQALSVSRARNEVLNAPDRESQALAERETPVLDRFGAAARLPTNGILTRKPNQPN